MGARETGNLLMVQRGQEPRSGRKYCCPESCSLLLRDLLKSHPAAGARFIVGRTDQ